MLKHSSFTLYVMLIGILFITLTAITVSRQLNKLYGNPDRGIINGNDGLHHYFWLRSPLFDGDLDFRNDELNYCPKIKRLEDISPGKITKTGLIVNKYGVGWAVLNLPWMATGHFGTLLYNHFGRDLPEDGHSKLYQFFIYLGNVFYGFLAIFFCYLIAAKFTDKKIALVAALLVWLSSNIFYYNHIMFSMSHHIVLLTMAVCYYYTFRIMYDKTKLHYWIIVGLSGGWMAITRYQAAIYLLFPVLIIVSRVFQYKSKKEIGLAAFALISFIIGIAPQLIGWKIVYGEWILNSYRGRPVWSDPWIWRSLFSNWQGLFYWHPVLLFGLTGFILMVAGKKDWRLYSILIILAINLYINASWHKWGHHQFGARAYEGYILISMLGVAFLIQKLRYAKLYRRIFLGLMLILVLWNFNLIILLSGKRVIKLKEPTNHSEIVEKSVKHYLE